MIGIIIATRENSSRVKNKALSKIGKKTAFEILLDRLKDFNVIIAATSTSKDLIKIAKDRDLKVYIGEDNSPLHRIYHAAQKYKIEHIVRITHDDILIDADLLKSQIVYHLENQLDYTYLGLVPQGTAGEVIKFEALELIAKRTGPTEFISYFLKTREFSFAEYEPPKEYQRIINACLDYKDDLKLLRIIFSLLGNKFSTLDIINLYKRHPEIFQINEKPLMTFYTCNYNYGEYIKECIESVLKQDVDFEYIIVDDFSSDNSGDIILETVSKYPAHVRDRVTILRNSENLGLAKSAVKCLSMAKGRYIMRVDSDDILYNVKSFIEKMQADKSDAVISGYRRNGKEVLDYHDHSGCGLFKTRKLNIILHRDNINIAEGTAFVEHFKDIYKISFLDKVLWEYREHEKSKTYLRG